MAKTKEINIRKRGKIFLRDIVNYTSRRGRLIDLQPGRVNFDDFEDIQS